MAQVQAGTYRLPVTIHTIEDVDRSGHWLAAGWRDFRTHVGISLTYGAIFVFVSLILTVGLLKAGLGSLILPMAGGFAILAPILVVGLYDVSRRIDTGQEVSMAHIVDSFRDNGGQLAAMGVALMVCYLVWVEVALFLFMIFFNQTPPTLDRFLQDVVFSLNGAPLLIVGSLVGAVFAAIVFSISAISVPLIFDRHVDVITAISASLLAVRRNYRLMFGWAALIALVTVVGCLTIFIGLAVAMPVLAFATWHAYKDLVDVSALEPTGSPNS